MARSGRSSRTPAVQARRSMSGRRRIGCPSSKAALPARRRRAAARHRAAQPRKVARQSVFARGLGSAPRRRGCLGRFAARPLLDVSPREPELPRRTAASVSATSSQVDRHRDRRAGRARARRTERRSSARRCCGRRRPGSCPSRLSLRQPWSACPGARRRSRSASTCELARTSSALRVRLSGATTWIPREPLTFANGTSPMLAQQRRRWRARPRGPRRSPRRSGRGRRRSGPACRGCRSARSRRAA